MSKAAKSRTQLPADLLDRPAHETVRWLVLARLDELVSERRRLDDPDDLEGLHDFRVALRRLRSVIRTYRSLLDESVTKKARRRLKELAALSGPSRDAQVHLEWLTGQLDHLAPDELPGATWVRRRLEQERREAERALRREVERRFGRLSRRLRDELRRYRITHLLGEPSGAPPSGRTVVCDALLKLTDELGERLAEVGSSSDVRELHQARIAGKRLRYMLEALADANDGDGTNETVRSLVGRLKTLQDQLGDVHDAHVFGRWLADRAAESGAARSRHEAVAVLRPNDDDQHGEKHDEHDEPMADLQAGIVALERSLRTRAEQAYDEVQASWPPTARDRFLEEVRAVAEEIAR